ncbi:MAG: hypothetical protein CL969_06485 [Euryarchaeota archaeon]|jgi:hypothetical protein|nr:hypothetical protein [Euryarchaeota archaeon]MDP6575748.1 hypothetical protein [Candidatus Peribacteraceae bacterium]|tara:strand:+ start:3540 stop:3872 length:333 start_codon:yes stop_codon:yes gene_type:complete
MDQNQLINFKWDIKDIYRLLMQNIEPELLPENYSTLEENYENESPEDRRKRYSHYADCFELFLAQLDVLMHMLKDHISEEYRILRKQLEQYSDNKEYNFLSSLDDFFEKA